MLSLISIPSTFYSNLIQGRRLRNGWTYPSRDHGSTRPALLRSRMVEEALAIRLRGVITEMHEMMRTIPHYGQDFRKKATACIYISYFVRPLHLL